MGPNREEELTDGRNRFGTRRRWSGTAIISALLVGLQPAGHGVAACLPAAIDACDAA
jgi:hypothetical protein